MESRETQLQKLLMKGLKQRMQKRATHDSGNSQENQMKNIPNKFSTLNEISPNKADEVTENSNESAPSSLPKSGALNDVLKKKFATALKSSILHTF